MRNLLRSHRQKRMRQVKRAQAKGVWNEETDDPFELFMSSTSIKWCYYKDSARILGQTHGMVVLQDFEALTPNLLCRTLETVEGGGIVVLLLGTMSSLRSLYTLSMDVHARFRTEAHQHVVPRFNERFLLSLASCANALVLDDELNVLPISKHAKSITAIGEEDAAAGSASAAAAELKTLKASLESTDMVGGLVGACVTLDQAKSVLQFSECIADKSLSTTVAVTAGRGRGKSAALGLGIAAAVGFGYSNIFVTSPSPENLDTLFQFVFKGLDALAYKEHLDYSAVLGQEGDTRGFVLRVNIFRGTRQTIQYIAPSDAAKLGQAELLVIDEAAAIPLPVVRALMGPYLIFMASTVNGYEGTGRSLSLKLIQQLRTASVAAGRPSVRQGQGGGWHTPKVGQTQARKHVAHQHAASAAGGGGIAGTGQRALKEISLEQPIRYAPGDGVEAWMNDLLCLDATSPYRIVTALPPPAACDLYLVNRDALFSYHKLSEAMLHRMMSLFVSSHYRNSPNDLQLMSDAPAHRLFALLGPAPSDGGLPDVLCVIQVCLEGGISKSTVTASLARGVRSAGDLIPWTMSQQFLDRGFPSLSGARIVRIATHPDATRMGYASHALDLLTRYYQGEITSLEGGAPAADFESGSGSGVGDVGDEGGSAAAVSNPTEEVGSLRKEVLAPRTELPPLLVALEDAPRHRLHWLGASFGLTASLFNFWRKGGYVPTYLRQTANELTSEHTCIMMKELVCSDLPDAPPVGWSASFSADFSRRFLALSASAFRTFASSTALLVVDTATAALAAAAAAYAEEHGLAPDAGAPGGAAARRVQKSLSSTAAAAAEAAAATAGESTGLHWAPLTAPELELMLTPHDLERLDSYARNLVDYHMITDLVPLLAQLFFTHRLPGLGLSRLQAALLMGVGAQRVEVDALEGDLNIPAKQLLALFNKAVRKLSKRLRSIREEAVDATIPGGKGAAAGAAAGAGKPKTPKGKKGKGVLGKLDGEFAVRGDDSAWQAAEAAVASAVAKGHDVSGKTLSVPAAAPRFVPGADETTPPKGKKRSRDDFKKEKKSSKKSSKKSKRQD